MTVINVSVRENEILCLTDTQTYMMGEGSRRKGRLVEQKCFVSPSETFAIAGAGALMTTRAMIDVVVAHCKDFAEAEDNLVSVAEYVFPDFTLFDETNTDTARFCLMGTHNGEMRAHLLNVDAYRIDHKTDKPKPRPDFSVKRLDKGFHPHPSLGVRGMAQLPNDIDEGALKKVALAQWKINQVAKDDKCIGGVQHITRVTSHGVEQYIAGLYPDYADSAAVGGDPNEHLVRYLFSEAA